MTPATLAWNVWKTPIGPLGAAVADGALVRIHIEADAATYGAELAVETGARCARDAGSVRAARDAIDAYLAGQTPDVAFPLTRPDGTPFQQAVWDGLRAIPRGQVRTYGWMARRVGRAKAVRAVGQANARNPLPLILPCHRIVQSDGRLGGYAGDRTPIKVWLLRLEGCEVVETPGGAARVARALGAA